MKSGFAIIQNIHPEGAIHWMAVSVEYIDRSDDSGESGTFAELVQFAIAEAHAHEKVSQLGYGFWSRFHFGAYGNDFARYICFPVGRAKYVSNADCEGGSGVTR